MKSETKFYEVDDSLSEAIYKGFEIFDVIRNTNIKIKKKMISLDDKKILSLYFGVCFSDNSVSSIIKKLKYNYNIEIHTREKQVDEYLRIYSEDYSQILDSLDFSNNGNVEFLTLYLLSSQVIHDFHEELGYPLMPLKMSVMSKLETKKSDDSKEDLDYEMKKIKVLINN